MEQARCVYDKTLSSVPQSTIGTLHSPACLAKSLWTRCKPGVVKGLLQLCKGALDTGHPAHPGREGLNHNIRTPQRASIVMRWLTCLCVHTGRQLWLWHARPASIAMRWLTCLCVLAGRQLWLWHARAEVPGGRWRVPARL